MSERTLDPENLLFHSFRHSQGATNPQNLMFRYMELRHGTAPDLHPTPDAWRRYVAFLGGAGVQNSTSHIAKDKPANEVYSAIKSIRHEYNTKDNRKLQKYDLPSIVNILAQSISKQESLLLSTETPWVSFISGKPAGRADRLKARVERGQASFLMYHGRDGHATGYDEFDGMYQAVWAMLQEPELADHLETLERSVADREFVALGGYLLARPHESERS